MISWNARFTIVALLLASTGLFLHALSDGQSIAPGTTLSSFPTELRNWAGVDIAIPAGMLASLGPGQFLQRTYQERRDEKSGVDLYLAYLPNRTALFRHLPPDCLIGSGWTTVESGVVTLAAPGDASFPANRYLISKGPDRQLVLFWYAAHGRRVAREEWMDWYLMVDSFRLNRTDSALIRLNTEVRPGDTPAEAEQRLRSFAGLIIPVLKNYIPN